MELGDIMYVLVQPAALLNQLSHRFALGSFYIWVIVIPMTKADSGVQTVIASPVSSDLVSQTLVANSPEMNPVLGGFSTVES